MNFQTTVAIKMIFDIIEYQFEHISNLNVSNTKLSADAFKKLFLNSGFFLQTPPTLLKTAADIFIQKKVFNSFVVLCIILLLYLVLYYDFISYFNVKHFVILICKKCFMNTFYLLTE